MAGIFMVARRDSSVPMWLDTSFDVVLALVLAATGAFFLATVYLFHTFLLHMVLGLFKSLLVEEQRLLALHDAYHKDERGL